MPYTGGRALDPAVPNLTGRAVYHAGSGLAAYDRAVFFDSRPIHGPLKHSDFGYGAIFQPRLRRVPEVVVEGGEELVIIMVLSSEHRMEVWIDGRHRALTMKRGDLIVLPPHIATRWCASEGQASVMHLHVSAPRLEEALGDVGHAAHKGLGPGLAFQDAPLQRLMRSAARLDEEDPLMSLKVAAIGSAVLLRLLQNPKIMRLA